MQREFERSGFVVTTEFHFGGAADVQVGLPTAYDEGGGSAVLKFNLLEVKEDRWDSIAGLLGCRMWASPLYSTR
jgi:hypothetical protein